MHSKTRQLDHHEVVRTKTSLQIVLVCDSVKSPANAGGLMRLADALGIESVYFCGETVNFESNRLKRTARSADKSVPYRTFENTLIAIDELKTNGYKLLGLELTTDSVPLQKLDISGFDKVGLVVGSERDGIHQQVLSELDLITHIEMHGENSSMNVGHAGAIALYNLINNQ